MEKCPPPFFWLGVVAHSCNTTGLHRKSCLKGKKSFFFFFLIEKNIFQFLFLRPELFALRALQLFSEQAVPNSSESSRTSEGPYRLLPCLHGDGFILLKFDDKIFMTVSVSLSDNESLF